MPAARNAVTGIGYTDRHVTDSELASCVTGALARLPVDHRRVLVIVPDLTRTMPLPQMVQCSTPRLRRASRPSTISSPSARTSPLNDAQLSRLLGRTVVGGAGRRRPRLQPRVGATRARS